VPPDEDERYFLEERRNILRHRLHLLKLRRDKQGDSTPADVILDIDATEREIDLVEAKLLLPSINARVAATVTPADPLLAIAQLARTLTERLDAGVAEMLGQTRDLATQIQFLTRSHRAAEDWRNAITDDVRKLKEVQEGDRPGRKRGRRLQYLILVLLGIVLAIQLWWLIR
jgi:hypothetical protein